MTIELYFAAKSPAARAVYMVCKELGLGVTLKEIDPMKKETQTPEFIKINPQHTVPTLVDNGFVIWESRAIMTYLINTYGTDKTEHFYPKDSKKRAHVDRLLFFDLEHVWQTILKVYAPRILKFNPCPDEVHDIAAEDKKIKETFDFLETFLGDQKYFTGDHYTVADFSIVTTMALLDAIKYDLGQHPKVNTWYKRLKSELSYFNECNDKGLNDIHELYLKAKESE
jgi:glutathione S-transferase